MKRPFVLFMLSCVFAFATRVAAYGGSPDGALCIDASDCASGYCFPGPFGSRMCLAKELNCPAPNHKGIAWGEYYYYDGGFHFCKSPGGIASAAINNGDIDFIMYDFEYSSRSGGGWTGRLAGEAAETAGLVMGAPPGAGTYVASKLLPDGEPSEGWADVKIDDPRYAYCNHDMRVMSIHPKSGQYRPRYGIGDVLNDGIRVRHRVPAGKLGDGGGSLILRVSVVAAKRERISDLRSQGLCRIPAGRIDETYRW